MAQPRLLEEWLTCRSVTGVSLPYVCRCTRAGTCASIVASAFHGHDRELLHARAAFAQPFYIAAVWKQPHAAGVMSRVGSYGTRGKGCQKEGGIRSTDQHEPHMLSLESRPRHSTSAVGTGRPRPGARARKLVQVCCGDCGLFFFETHFLLLGSALAFSFRPCRCSYF